MRQLTPYHGSSVWAGTLPQKLNTTIVAMSSAPSSAAGVARLMADTWSKPTFSARGNCHAAVSIALMPTRLPHVETTENTIEGVKRRCIGAKPGGVYSIPWLIICKSLAT